MEDYLQDQNTQDAAPDVIEPQTWDATVNPEGGITQIGSGLSAVGKPLQSTNFVEGSTGWRINSNGEAEFQNVIIRPQTYTFTSDGTFTLPVASKLLFVQCWGGGGSGGAANAATDGTASATGGGAGEYKSALYFSSILTGDVTVTIGAAGTAVSTSGRQAVAGVAGGTTSFGSFLTAGGGAAGDADIAAGVGTASSLAATGGTGGTTTFIAVANENGADSGSSSSNGSTCAHTENVGGSTTNSGGGGGSANGNNPCVSGFSSAGGTSTNGGSGGAGSNTTGVAGSVPAGGGGGAANKDAAVTSGAGGKGKCIVTVF